MLILCTAALAHVLAKHGMLWEGVTSAYLLALFLDAGLLALLIFRLTEK